jgi:hypothetical protein
VAPTRGGLLMRWDCDVARKLAWKGRETELI